MLSDLVSNALFLSSIVEISILMCVSLALNTLSHSSRSSTYSRVSFTLPTTPSTSSTLDRMAWMLSESRS